MYDSQLCTLCSRVRDHLIVKVDVDTVKCDLLLCPVCDAPAPSQTLEK